MRVNITPHPTKPGWHYVEYRPNGYKGKRERLPFSSYEAACIRRDQLLAQHDEPTVQELTPRLKDVKAEYLLWVEKYRSKSTLDNKRCRLNGHIIPGLGDFRVKDLTQRILDDYSKTMATMSYRDDIYHLLALITWMTKRRYCKPLDWKPEIPEYRQPIKTIPAPEDILLYLEAIRDEDKRTLFSLMLYTGLRWNEARHLRWEDYQEDSLRLSVTKTKVQERIYIPENLQQWFRDHCKPAGWIFIAKGRKAPYVNLQKALLAAGEATGIKMTPHLFRHASATLLYEISEDLYAVKNHLRQSRITTTEIYTRYSIQRSRKAVNSLVVHMDKIKTPITIENEKG